MSAKHFLLLTVAVLLLNHRCANAQEKDAILEPVWNTFQHESAASFRGVHVVGDGEAIWISGSKGTVLQSLDQGMSWKDVSPADAGELDFRDVHGFDGQSAVALAVGSPAKIYRTSTSGKSWDVVFEDKRPNIFFDAFTFWDDQNGIAFSDPINGKVVIIKTSDGGKIWRELEFEKQPAALEGEGGFAASGTCLCLNGDTVFIGLGGARKEGDPSTARMLMSPDRGETWQVVATPIKSGAARGIFSIVFANADHGVAVGGTYNEPDDTSSHICITEDGGRNWFRPESTTRAYRSCVVVQRRSSAEAPRLIAVGKTGTDYSDDYGRSWKPLDDQGFYAVDSGNRGVFVVAVGPEGRIGILPTIE